MPKKKKVKVSSFEPGEKSLFVEDLSPSLQTPYEVDPEYVRIRAKALYIIHNWKPERLMEELGIPKGTLQAWLYQGTHGELAWTTQKKLHQEACFHEIKQHTLDQMKGNASTIDKLVSRGLQAMLESENEPTVKEMEQLTNIRSKYSSMVDTIEAKPEGEQEKMELTKEQMQEIIDEVGRLDPFGGPGGQKIN